MKTNNLEKFGVKFVEMMTSKIRSIEKDFTVPWFTNPRKDFMPRNLNGRKYRGGNVIMLLLFLMELRSMTPYFVTFKQAKTLGLSVNKGAEAFPVFYYLHYCFHKVTREKIDMEDYNLLPDTEKKEYCQISTAKYYNVFSMEHTNFPEQYPEKWKELVERHSAKKRKPERDESGLTVCTALDTMLEEKKWICEIILRLTNKAYYSGTDDHIVCPEKKQFKDGESFYATILHEMTHSTKGPNRLNRPEAKEHGDENYCREELVAELSAALCSYFLGFGSTICDENAAYLKSWLSKLEESPEYLIYVLSDSTKAVRYIFNQLGMEQMFEDDQPVLSEIEEIAA